METRLEKNKKKKLSKFKLLLKTIIVLALVFSLFVGINLVNDTIKALNCMKNTRLFSFDLENYNLEFLGQKYFIDLKVLKTD